MVIREVRRKCKPYAQSHEASQVTDAKFKSFVGVTRPKGSQRKCRPLLETNSRAPFFAAGRVKHAAIQIPPRGNDAREGTLIRSTDTDDRRGQARRASPGVTQLFWCAPVTLFPLVQFFCRLIHHSGREHTSFAASADFEPLLRRMVTASKFPPTVH
jgi:hypothetical protein